MYDLQYLFYIMVDTDNLYSDIVVDMCKLYVCLRICMCMLNLEIVMHE